MNIFLLILSIVGCELVGIISGYFTITPIKTWYTKLKKPSFNPPNSIFGPVWTTLYALMGISFYLIFSDPKHTSFAVMVFLVQLTLNFLWSFIFFSFKQLTFAFVEILLLLCMIGITIISFWPINYIASILLIPYLLWVSFATLLNFRLMKLNP